MGYEVRAMKSGNMAKWWIFSKGFILFLNIALALNLHLGSIDAPINPNQFLILHNPAPHDPVTTQCNFGQAKGKYI